MANQLKPKHRTIVTSIYPDRVQFLKAQFFVLVISVISSIVFQTMLNMIDLINWSSPRLSQLMANGLPFSFIWVIVPTVLFLTITLIHGYIATSYPWHLTTRRIIHRKKEVVRLYEVSDIEKGLFWVVLHNYGGNSHYMFYVKNPDSVIKILLETRAKLLEKYETTHT